MQTEILIKPIKLIEMPITIKGISSILLNAMSVAKMKRIADERDAKKGGLKPLLPLTPREQYQSCFYPSSNKIPTYPSSGIKKSMRLAVKEFAPNIAQVTVGRLVHIIEDYIEIQGDKPIMRHDVGRCSGQGRAPRDIYRAEIKNWTMKFRIQLNTEGQIKAQDVIEILKYAGFHIGIGDWRPEKGGNFGRFELQIEKSKR